MVFLFLWCVSLTVCTRATPQDFYIVEHFRPAFAEGKCFLGLRIYTIFRGGLLFIFLFRFYSAIILAVKSVLCGRAFVLYPRARGFASEKQHIEKRERRFVGFVKPSNRRFFAFQDRSRAEARRGESKWQEEQIKASPVTRCCG